jgi:hypothetical protein
LKLKIQGVEIEIAHFEQADYDAVKHLLELEFSDLSLKNRDLIENAFTEATRRGPQANPSDLWHHVVYRLYMETARRYRPNMADPGQSWKRASGDAFELFLQRYYNRILAQTNFRLIALIEKIMRVQALKLLNIYGKVGDSKLDIAIMGDCDPQRAPSLANGRILGGIHAKVSLAERVSDDIPASAAMMQNGFVSYLMTLDVKSFPLSNTISGQRAYINKGELGSPASPTDKRKYIEEHGSFDACFSFNLRTVASLPKTMSGKRIFVNGLGGRWDHFCDLLSTMNKG